MNIQIKELINRLNPNMIKCTECNKWFNKKQIMLFTSYCIKCWCNKNSLNSTYLYTNNEIKPFIT
jgi:predicted  nucleic acid-binding Zn-ribbon protein